MFDRDELLKQLGGNQPLMLTFIKACLKDIAEEMDNLEAALNARDWELAVKAAHTIKGVAGNMRSAALAKTALDMEQAAEEHDMELASLIKKKLCAEFNQLALDRHSIWK